MQWVGVSITVARLASLHAILLIKLFEMFRWIKFTLDARFPNRFPFEMCSYFNLIVNTSAAFRHCNAGMRAISCCKILAQSIQMHNGNWQSLVVFPWSLFSLKWTKFRDRLPFRMLAFLCRWAQRKKVFGPTTGPILHNRSGAGAHTLMLKIKWKLVEQCHPIHLFILIYTHTAMHPDGDYSCAVQNHCHIVCTFQCKIIIKPK